MSDKHLSKSLGPKSEPLEFDVEVPSDEMEEKFEKWGEIYTTEKLTDMSLNDIESERLMFENEVDRFRVKYTRGKSLNSAMAKVMGEKPYTHDQLREARRLIDDEANRIRPRFKRAKGIVEKEEKTKFREFIEGLVDRAEIVFLKVQR